MGASVRCLVEVANKICKFEPIREITRLKLLCQALALSRYNKCLNLAKSAFYHVGNAKCKILDKVIKIIND